MVRNTVPCASSCGATPRMKLATVPWAEQREGEGHPRLRGPQPERQRAERQIEEQVAA